MYHRICPVEQARPWFARGTAVTPTAFQRQMQWLVRNFEVVPLRTLLKCAGDRARPQASITFDDGYVDTFVHALPICEELGLVGTVFPVAGYLADEGRSLWFDAFYTLLQRAIPTPESHSEACILGIPLGRWVRGPEKERLQLAPPTQRETLLDDLAEQLGLGQTPDKRRDALYLSSGQLRHLVSRGWGIGGHGQTHSRFPLLGDAALQHELQASLHLASHHDPGEPILAYPDGAHDTRVVDMARSIGFRWGLTVTPGTLVGGSATDPARAMTLPRFFCRGDQEQPTAMLVTDEV